MTPDEINKIIAEWDGWKLVPRLHAGAWWVHNGTMASLELPCYTSDLNAICEVTRKLNGQLKEDWEDNALNLMSDGFSFDHYGAYFDFAHLTAAQRSEAFVRAVGKWREE